MKVRKLLFLTLVLLFAMLLIPNFVKAADITEVIIDASGIIPLGGETPKQLVLGEDAEYKIQAQSWEDASGRVLTSADKFVIGDTYIYRLTIEPKDGNKFLNGIDTKVINISSKSSSISYKSEYLIHIDVECVIPEPRTVTVNASEGVKVTPSGSFTVYEGYSKELSIIVEKGYELDSVTIDGEEIYSSKFVNNTYVEISNDRKTILLRNVANDINVSIKAEKINTIEVLVENPKIGATPKDIKVTIPESDKYEVKECIWLTPVLEGASYEGEVYLLKQDEKFEEGKEYYITMVLEQKESGLSNYVVVTVNGKDAYIDYATGNSMLIICDTAFKAVAEANEDKEDNEDKEVKEDTNKPSSEGEEGVEEIVPESTNPNNTSSNPPTGDNIGLFACLLVISMVGVGSVYLYGKTSKEKK